MACENLLVQSLKAATGDDSGTKLNLITALTFRATAAVEDAPGKWDAREGKPAQNPQPVLVTREGSEALLGILTPYDLL